MYLEGARQEEEETPFPDKSGLHLKQDKIWQIALNIWRKKLKTGSANACLGYQWAPHRKSLKAAPVVKKRPSTITLAMAGMAPSPSEKGKWPTCLLTLKPQRRAGSFKQLLGKSLPRLQLWSWKEGWGLFGNCMANMESPSHAWLNWQPSSLLVLPLQSAGYFLPESILCTLGEWCPTSPTPSLSGLPLRKSWVTWQPGCWWLYFLAWPTWPAM